MNMVQFRLNLGLDLESKDRKKNFISLDFVRLKKRISAYVMFTNNALKAP